MCFLITMHLMLVDQSNWVDRKKITLKDSSSSFYNSNEYENVPLRILIIQISRHLPCTFLSNNAPLSDTSATYDTTQRADTPPSFFFLEGIRLYSAQIMKWFFFFHSTSFPSQNRLLYSLNVFKYHSPFLPSNVQLIVHFKSVDFFFHNQRGPEQ